MIEIDRPDLADSAFTVGGDTLGAKAADVVDEARQTFEQLKDSAIEKAAAADTFIRERPYAALGLAVIAGMVISHILGAGRPQVVYLREPRRPLLHRP